MNTNYDELASTEIVVTTEKSLTENGFIPEVVENGEAAFRRIKELVPAGASVMNGASKTLTQIGYVEFLKSGEHGWNNLHEAVLAEKDPAKQSLLRRQSVVSDFYLGSAHVVTQKGELVFASFSGSQMPHLVFTSPNIVLVVSTKKIVPTLPDAFLRLDNHTVPLEDERLMQANGIHTVHAKTVILHKESPMMGRKIHVILVKENLGF